MERHRVKRTYAALGLIGLICLTGCNQTPEPAPAPSGSTTVDPTEPSEVASEAPEASTAAEASAAPQEPAIKTASYPPRDDCTKQAGWRDFRAKLGLAVARRDADALAALTAPEVQLDYGGGHGIDTMRKRLTDKDYRLWDKLTAILPLGCGFQGGLAAMPWVFWNTPEKLDPYQGMWVTGMGVPLLETASPTAKPLAPLDWALVEAAPHMEANPKFLKVTELASKTTGYVDAKRVRSVIDYRMIAEPKDGGWRITAVIAGD